MKPSVLSRMAMRCYAAVDDDQVPEGATPYRGFLVGRGFFPDAHAVDEYIRFTVERFNAGR